MVLCRSRLVCEKEPAKNSDEMFTCFGYNAARGVCARRWRQSTRSSTRIRLKAVRHANACPSSRLRYRCAPIGRFHPRCCVQNRLRCPKVGGGSFGHLTKVRPRRDRNNAPPETTFAPPPGRNLDHFAPPPNSNHQQANTLRVRAGAKFTEFRPTRKRKNFRGCKNHRVCAVARPQVASEAQKSRGADLPI